MTFAEASLKSLEVAGGHNISSLGLAGMYIFFGTYKEEVRSLLLKDQVIFISKTVLERFLDEDPKYFLGYEGTLRLIKEEEL